MRITDRAKDVIKSGGEWISSIALENLAVGHPTIAEAAALIAWLTPHVAKWWLPDDIVDQLPHSAAARSRRPSCRALQSSGRPAARRPVTKRSPVAASLISVTPRT